MKKFKPGILFVVLLFSLFIFTGCKKIKKSVTVTITWKNYDGEVLKTEEVPSGTKPTFKGDNPRKPDTVSHTYEFSGWTPEVTEVTANTTYTAQFTENIKKFTITWKNFDGTLLKTTEVDSNTLPIYDGVIPTKPGNGICNYKFIGWDPKITEATTHITYTAQFTETPKKFTVTWKNYDGTTLDTKEVDYGTVPTYNGATPTKPEDEGHIYTFSGWDKEVTAVTGDTIYTAQFTETLKKFTITWKNFDGTLLKTNEVDYGTIPTYDGLEPTKPETDMYKYTFIGWTPEVVAVTGDVVYTAQFTESLRTFTITWQDYRGWTIKTSEVEYGKVPEFNGTTPTKPDTESHTFTFSGWSPEFVAVTSDASYTAQFTENIKIYTVIWKNHDDTVLETDNDVPYGAHHSYDGATPTKPNDGSYDYEFTGWSRNISIPNSEIVYTALFGKVITSDTELEEIYEFLSINGDTEWAIKKHKSYKHGTDLILPSSYKGKPIRVISGWAFYNSQITSIKISSSVTIIDGRAFHYCYYLSSVTIPNSVTTIGEDAFLSCNSLISVTFPSSLITIGKSAFSGCSSLTSVTIPNSVTTIGDGAFAGCNRLTSIKVEPGNTKYDSRDNCNAIIESATNKLIKGCNTTIIPNTVTEIGDYAFAACYFLTSITIPDSVTTIGYRAFCYCTSLTSIVIPNSVTTIGGYAFEECKNLTSVTLSSSLMAIGSGTFEDCRSLTSITIPNSVTTIGESAFSRCHSLISVTIPNSVTEIGRSAFNSCSSLTSVTIPNSVTTIGDGAFAGCNRLTSIKVEPGNTKYDSRDNCNAIIESATNKLIKGCDTTIIPNTITEIGEHAFLSCNSLTSIIIPDSVTTIGIAAFYGCSSLSSVTISNSVTAIDSYAFSKCSSLTSIIIPNSVVTINEAAFKECTSLSSVTISNSVVTINEEAFKECTSLSSVTIPNSVTMIGNGVFADCNRLTSIKVEEGNPKYDSRDNCNAIIESATNKLIKGCDTTIIPNTITEIGEHAFLSCNSLTSITIPDSVTVIGRGAFAWCYSLTSIVIPDSVTTINEYAFNGCGTNENKFQIFAKATSKPAGWEEPLSQLDNCKIYWYSETENKDGKHWHYVEGIPTVWE